MKGALIFANIVLIIIAVDAAKTDSYKISELVRSIIQLTAIVTVISGWTVYRDNKRHRTWLSLWVERRKLEEQEKIAQLKKGGNA